MDFPYPVRDRDCSTGVCYNNSGLDIPTAGCQVLDGAQALALSRSRYFQYYADGEWNSDPSSDIGRIERQNLIISAALDKAKSTYNPLRLNTLLTSVVHDFSKDNGLTAGDLFALAERYHAFSGSQLQAYTLPTVGRARRRAAMSRWSSPTRPPRSSPSSSADRSGPSPRRPSTPTATRSPSRRPRRRRRRRPPAPTGTRRLTTTAPACRAHHDPAIPALHDPPALAADPARVDARQMPPSGSASTASTMAALSRSWWSTFSARPGSRTRMTAAPRRPAGGRGPRRGRTARRAGPTSSTGQPKPAATAAMSGAWGVPNSALEGGGVEHRGRLEEREDPAATVVGHHHRQVDLGAPPPAPTPRRRGGRPGPRPGPRSGPGRRWPRQAPWTPPRRCRWRRGWPAPGGAAARGAGEGLDVPDGHGRRHHQGGLGRAGGRTGGGPAPAR